MTDIQYWYASGGEFVARGRDTIVPGPRDYLIAGTYRPDATTTGVISGTSLTASSGNMTITDDDTVVENMDIFGFVDIRAANVKIKNCRVRGGTDSGLTTALIKCLDDNCSNALIQDCLLQPDNPSEWINGIMGHDFTAQRNEILNCCDGIDVFWTTNPTADISVLIEQNYIHDQFFVRPAANGTRPEGTHNDCIQVSAGTNIHVLGNNLQAFIASGMGSASDTGRPNYPSLAYMTGIIITPDVGAIASMTVDKNYLGGGSATVNISEKSYGPLQDFAVKNNTFDRTSYLGKAILSPSTTTAVADFTGNVWSDDGTAVPVSKGS